MEKGRVTQGHFPQPETLLLFRKSLVPMLPHWRKKLFLTTHSSLGLFDCINPSLTRGQIVCIITQLIRLYLVCE